MVRITASAWGGMCQDPRVVPRPIRSHGWRWHVSPHLKRLPAPRATGPLRAPDSIGQFYLQVGPWSDAIPSVTLAGYAVSTHRPDKEPPDLEP
jgi:hypothetical protein